MIYEPYNFDSFKELVSYAQNLGWYGGRKMIFNLKCEGEFEGWSGRSTEGWEQKFTLTTEQIELQSGKIFPAIIVSGSTVKEACDKAIKLLVNK